MVNSMSEPVSVERLPEFDDRPEYVHDILKLCGAIDHLLTQPVSGYWQRRYPRQYEKILGMMCRIRESYLYPDVPKDDVG